MRGEWRWTMWGRGIVGNSAGGKKCCLLVMWPSWTITGNPGHAEWTDRISRSTGLKPNSPSLSLIRGGGGGGQDWGTEASARLHPIKLPSQSGSHFHGTKPANQKKNSALALPQGPFAEIIGISVDHESHLAKVKNFSFPCGRAFDIERAADRIPWRGPPSQSMALVAGFHSSLIARTNYQKKTRASHTRNQDEVEMTGCKAISALSLPRGQSVSLFLKSAYVAILTPSSDIRKFYLFRHCSCVRSGWGFDGR
ncbi:hypothetical protein BDK51DRAFT_35139 [Blyttiomyces helicus]|uniref:Uncharacterized protein n=1 Tax=Blyttiomyces helicus TaxID=388810 RepID=A0A4P9WGI9_9FUNG|nr:hypothetical protein BDK51DRAFT_35139 [Blyttiomyces helicus]|eukprot:RKO89586.1 hypothetical protein BDK51DRAFT_35139 [Blyttiomyces helicus]